MPFIKHPAEAAAFLLDWDGVLADTRLDFSSVRKKYFGGRIVTLSEAAAELAEPDRSLAFAEISRIEMEGADAAAPVKGAKDLIDWLAGKRKPWAVVSRNSMDSILLAAKRCGITLPPVTLSREAPYVNPDGRALKLAAEKLGVPLDGCIMVGDFKYDLEAAKNAGIPSVFVRAKTGEEWEKLADFAYSSVKEFAEALNR